MNCTIKRYKNLCSNPYELLNLIPTKNVRYGVYDELKYKAIYDDDTNYDKKYLFENGVVIHPKKLLRYKVGTCWDTSLFFWYYLNRMKGIKAYALYVESFNERSHMLSYYVDENKRWYWIEYSWWYYRGIHGPFSEKKYLFNHIENMFNNTDYKNYIHIANYDVDLGKLLSASYGNNIPMKVFWNCCTSGAQYFNDDEKSQREVWKIE